MLRGRQQCKACLMTTSTDGLRFTRIHFKLELIELSPRLKLISGNSPYICYQVELFGHILWSLVCSFQPWSCVRGGLSEAKPWPHHEVITQLRRSVLRLWTRGVTLARFWLFKRSQDYRGCKPNRSLWNLIALVHINWKNTLYNNNDDEWNISYFSNGCSLALFFS